MLLPAMGRLSLAFCFLLLLAFFIVFKIQTPTLIFNTVDWTSIKDSMPMGIIIPNAILDTDERNRTFELRFKNIRMEYQMNFTDPCSNSTKVLILSLTRRDGFENRQGIRQTWMSDAKKSEEIIRFLIADANEKPENKTITKLLEEEQAKHGDLLFIRGLTDTYKHVTLKIFAGWQWQQAYCPKVEWVLKADDDTIVHLRRFEYWAKHKFQQIVAEHPLVFMGKIIYHDNPKRDNNSKWYMPESEFPGDEYPEYVHGPVYLTNPATIGAILAQSPKSLLVNMEDVLNTGILGNLANVTRVHLWQYFTYHVEYIYNCENGIPTGISMWGINTIKDFEEYYKKLKSVNCTKPK